MYPFVGGRTKPVGGRVKSSAGNGGDLIEGPEALTFVSREGRPTGVRGAFDLDDDGRVRVCGAFDIIEDGRDGLMLMLSCGSFVDGASNIGFS